MSAHHEITVKELSAFAKNPLRPYFRKTLGIYLKEEEQQLPADDIFTLPSLERYLIKNAAFENEEVFLKAEAEGRLPPGVFKDLEVHRMQRENRETLEAYRTFGISPGDLYTLEVELTLPRFTITGKLENVCKEGLVFKDKDVIKAYPLFLLLCTLIQEQGLQVKPQLLALKSRKVKNPFLEDPKAAMTAYLEYYVQALHHPSPLIPEWIQPILTAKSLSIRELYNEELKWVFHNELDPSEWKNTAQRLYREWFDAPL